MHAFVISGGSPEKRQTEINKKLQEWQVSSFDQIILTTEEGSIGVSEIRAFQQRLQLSPLQGSYTAGIIPNAHLATTEAQNALLKTLEEPPPHTRLILEAPSMQSFLPTILSRCQLISLGTSDQYTTDDLLQCFKTLKQLQEARLGERIKIIDAVTKDREETKAWVEQAIVASRTLLLASPTPQTTHFIRRLIEAQKHLAANANPKLILDQLFIEF